MGYLFRSRLKTLMEMKAVYAALDQGIKVRARRNIRHLPNAWDDIKVSNMYDRSWKLYRKHHYKRKGY